MSNKYSKAIVNLRKEKGLSQAELATILGVSRQTVNYIEKDEKHLTPRIMSIIKEKFGDLVNYINVESITQAERFRYVRTEIIDTSQINLASILGVKPQVIADIESGRKQKIDNDILQKLYEEYGIKLEWLLFGIGNQTLLDDMDEIEYTYCNDNVASIKKYDFNLTEKENIDKVIENDKDVLYFDRRWLRNILGVNPDNIFFIYAPDDSMDSGKNTANDIKKGDILFIDISQKQGNNKVFVYKNDFDNEYSIRQIKWSLSENIKLVPYNKKYKSEIVEKQVNEFLVNIIGQIVWNGNRKVF